MLLEQGKKQITEMEEGILSSRPGPGRWSKKEELGHLIDSALNNLRRFTEIDFMAKPYSILPYDQDALVRVNDYQSEHTKNLVDLWYALNRRIMAVADAQTEETLRYAIVLHDGTTSDLHFLIVDYVDHLEHHLRRILQTK